MLTRKQWQPLQVPQCAAVLEPHGQWCTVRDMMQKVRAEPLDTGPGLQVLSLVRLARGHHSHGSPWVCGAGGGWWQGLNPDAPHGQSTGCSYKLVGQQHQTKILAVGSNALQ